jgi:hypothetical protein
VKIILACLLLLHLANGRLLSVRGEQVVAWAGIRAEEGAHPKARAALWTLAPTIFYVIEEPADITKQMEASCPSTK